MFEACQLDLNERVGLKHGLGFGEGKSITVDLALNRVKASKLYALLCQSRQVGRGVSQRYWAHLFPKILPDRYEISLDKLVALFFLEYHFEILIASKRAKILNRMVDFSWF